MAKVSPRWTGPGGNNVILASRKDFPVFTWLQATLGPALSLPSLYWGPGPEATALCFLLSSLRTG